MSSNDNHAFKCSYCKFSSDLYLGECFSTDFNNEDEWKEMMAEGGVNCPHFCANKQEEEALKTEEGPSILKSGHKHWKVKEMNI